MFDSYRKAVGTIGIIFCLFSSVFAYSGGSGEPNNPYQIATKADLLALGSTVADYNKCFVLMADIDLDPNLPGGQVFTKAIIAADTDTDVVNYIFHGNAFTGTFDGNGHIINNLTINTNVESENYLGLFGYISGGKVKNLGFTNVSINDGEFSGYIGGLAGYSDNNSNISNCYSTGTITGGTYLSFIGGLVGDSNYSSISNCYSTGIVVTGGSYLYCIGGLVGRSDYSNISDCCSTGTFTGIDYIDCLGGLVGEIDNSSNISNCYSTNTITVADLSGKIGGLVGENYNGNINNCHSTCTIIGGGVSDAGGFGGLVGSNYGSISNCYSTGTVTVGGGGGIGGLVGSSEYSSISTCYSTDAVIGGECVGGLVGQAGGQGSCNISNCYSTGTVTGGDYSGFLGGLVGLGEYSSISNCYSTGAVTGGYNSYCLGGLVGGDNGSNNNINSSYFLITSGPNNGYGTPLSDECMKLQTSFIGWNFHAIWDIVECRTYPFFRIGAGTGTPDDPYKIATKADLLAMAIDTSSYDKGFILTADIDMEGQVFTKSIIATDTSSSSGFQGTAFTGTFDGNDHKITNFTINGDDYLGLFGQSSGSIKNLDIENYSVSGSQYVGGLVGDNYGSISECYSTGTVTGGNNSYYLGGLSGYNSGTINNCYSTNIVAGGDNSDDLGGLVGLSEATISNCYSTSAVSGTQNIGGLVGYSYIGHISNCYSTGSVSGTSNLGGLSGYNHDVNISNCYFLITSGPNNGYGTPLTDEQMKQQSSFIGWDFTTIWSICEGTNYPRLQWQIPAADWSCPDGVNMEDLSYFVQRWLESDCASSNNYCSGTDMNASGTVDFKDFALFASHWLEGVTP